MDYTPHFRLIQTALTHCNEFVKKFDKITHYQGNEIYINEITLKLKNIFLANGLTDEECPELRKINLFLMLNTNVKLKYDLNEDFQICHLLNNFPQLTKCLFFNLMWQLKLEKYFFEAVMYSPSWFVIEFMDEIVDSLKFSKSFDVIRQVKEIVEAIYTNICRMDYRSNISGEVNDKKLILERFVDAVSSSLSHYNTPVTEESITKSRNKTKKYNGYTLNYQLTLILTCFKMFLKNPSFEVNEKFHIYKIAINKDPETNNFSTNKYSQAVCEILTEINVMLLNTLQNTLFNMTLDDFTYWAEIDMEDNLIEDVDLKRDTLQKSIGEQAYELINIINSDPSFEHNVIQQLTTVSMKPLTVAQIAKEETIGTILEKIESSPSRVVWLEELLNRADTLYCNTECLQTVIDNIEIVTFDHLMKMLKDHQNYDMDQEDEGHINEIFLKGGSKLNINDMKDFIGQLINTLGTDYSISSDARVTREEEVTNYLNKITQENLEESKMWNLILKNPQLFYEKLLEEIDSQDETQISTILKVISVTAPISSEFLKRIIISHMESQSEVNGNSSRHLLLSGIFKLQIMDRKEFVKDILMNNFSQALTSTSLNPMNLLIYLRTLKQLSSQLKITDLLPPLMIQLAQILDKFRWDLMSYSTLKEEVVDITIPIIQELIKIILINGTKNDKEWIKSKTNNLKPITKFYFQKLSLEKGEAITLLDSFLHPGGFSNIPKIKITSFLCETIVRCTSKEIRKLMANEILQNFYAEALGILSTIAKKSNQTAPLECLRKCVTDYVKILADIIIPTVKSKSQEDELLKEIINLIKKFPSCLHDDLTILFLEPLKELQNCENFPNLISEIDECELKRILME